MKHISPEWLHDFESNMRVIAEDSFTDAMENRWSELLLKKSTTTNRRELRAWFLETAKIERLQESEQLFEDLEMVHTEFEVGVAGAGLRLHKHSMLDQDGHGIDAAGEWSRQMGHYAGYWPQQILAEAILANPVAYDGKPFFANAADAHLINPKKEAMGRFVNHFTGAAVTSGAVLTPGALPVVGVTAEEALRNLARARSYIASIKMPNGKVPRGLRVVGILCPPALTSRFDEITEAKFIAQAVGGGAASGDVSGIQARMGWGPAIEAPELGAEYGGSDTDYYLITKQASSTVLGAFTFVEREVFNIMFHGPMTTAELRRKRVFEWTMEGRNVVTPGHPFGLFKCSAT